MERTIGILCGIAVGFLVSVLLLKWTKKDNSSKCKFDERQELVRGRGFKYGFISLIIGNFLYAVIDLVFEKKVIDTLAGMTICVIIAVLVHASYCIWNEGYFAMNENPQKVLVMFSGIAVLNFVIFLINALHRNIIIDGVVTFGIANFFCGIMCLVIFAVLFIKWKRDNREEE